MAELNQALELGGKALKMVSGYPLWIKVVAVILLVVVGLVALRLLGGEGGD